MLRQKHASAALDAFHRQYRPLRSRSLKIRQTLSAQSSPTVPSKWKSRQPALVARVRSHAFDRPSRSGDRNVDRAIGHPAMIRDRRGQGNFAERGLVPDSLVSAPGDFVHAFKQLAGIGFGEMRKWVEAGFAQRHRARARRTGATGSQCLRRASAALNARGVLLRQTPLYRVASRRNRILRRARAADAGDADCEAVAGMPRNRKCQSCVCRGAIAKIAASREGRARPL